MIGMMTIYHQRNSKGYSINHPFEPERNRSTQWPLFTHTTKVLVSEKPASPTAKPSRILQEFEPKDVGAKPLELA